MIAAILGDLRGIGVLSASFAVLIFAAEVVTRRCSPPAELSRKAVHLGGGLLCAFFPYLVRSAWSVFLLALGMAIFFLLGRRLRFLQCLNRVTRTSRGSEYYPLAIFLVFLLTPGQPWFFVAAVLVLGCADSGAALIGGSFGRLRYSVDTELKSVEGSLAFFLLALAGIAMPLKLLSPLPLPIVLLSSVLVALLVTGIEAISRHGRDNLFVPLGVVLILQKITTKPLAEVLYQNVSLVSLAALMLALAWVSESMNAGAALCLLLLTYGAWSLGSEVWAVPLLCGLLVFLFSWTYTRGCAVAPERLRSARVVQALVVPFLLLVTANLLHDHDFYFAPFAASAAAVTLTILWDHRFGRARTVAEIARHEVIWYTLVAVLMVLLPSYLSCTAQGSLALIIPSGALMLASLMLYAQRRQAVGAPLYRWNKTALLPPLLVSVVVLAAQLLGLPLWAG